MFPSHRNDLTQLEAGSKLVFSVRTYKAMHIHTYMYVHMYIYLYAIKTCVYMSMSVASHPYKWRATCGKNLKNLFLQVMQINRFFNHASR